MGDVACLVGYCLSTNFKFSTNLQRGLPRQRSNLPKGDKEDSRIQSNWSRGVIRFLQHLESFKKDWPFQGTQGRATRVRSIRCCGLRIFWHARKYGLLHVNRRNWPLCSLGLSSPLHDPIYDQKIKRKDYRWARQSQRLIHVQRYNQVVKLDLS